MRSRLNKQNVRKLLNASYWVLFIVLALTAILVIFTTYDSKLPIKIYTVQSGSMEPALSTGSLIFVKPSNVYDVKDIISFRNPDKQSQIITHRISAVLYEEDGNVFVTKGDANETSDIQKVSRELIIGKVNYDIPVLGKIVNFAKTKQGTILLVVVPAVFFVISEISNLVQLIRIYRKGGVTA